MKRSKHSLSHYRLVTCDMGELIPVANFEVLPGDSMRIRTSALIRCSPLVAPVMHPVQVRFHTWFVPYRLLWDGWESFITGGSDGQGDGVGNPPFISAPLEGFQVGQLMDYLGVPPAVPGLPVSAFQVKAYNLIYNEFYRDQDLCTEVALTDLGIKRVAWEKDYFTSARPWPQKGPDISMPLGTSAPVLGTGQPLGVRVGTSTETHPLNQYNSGGFHINSIVGANQTTGDISVSPTGQDSGLYADLSNATAVNVNDVRRAFALQRYQEARARYGSRYTEYLRYLGVRSSDARLQRPEYLGGGKQTISFSEVIQSYGNLTDAGDNPLGKLGGHGISAMRSRASIRYFEEHGCVLTLMSVRPRTMYTDGLHRQFLRRSKEDFWQKELELIGQQEVENQELYAGASYPQTFGYQDRYAEYRHHPSQVTAEFRDLLNYWHLARQFTQLPVLNASFVECNPSKRIYAEQTQDALWCMVNNAIQARRMVRRAGESRII